MADASDTGYILVKGVRLPDVPLVKTDAKFVEDLDRFHTRKDDVFVVTHPKSGTIWTSEILWQVCNNGATSDVNIRERVYWLEMHPLLHRPELDHPSPPTSKPALDLLPSPRLMNSHLPYHVIPKGQETSTSCKYIYVVRNPKDVIVSLYHFYQAIPAQKEQGIFTLEMMVKTFLQGGNLYGPWFDHVLGWWNHRDDANVLFLKYESMKKDTLAAVKAIAEFLGKSLSDDVIQRIAHQCSIGEMAKNSQAYMVFPGVEETNYLRKGEVGDWKNHLTPEMSEKFEAEIISKLKEHGLEFQ